MHLGSMLGGESLEQELSRLREQEKQHHVARDSWAREKQTGAVNYRELKESLKDVKKQNSILEEDIKKLGKALDESAKMKKELQHQLAEQAKGYKETRDRLEGIKAKEQAKQSELNDAVQSSERLAHKYEDVERRRQQTVALVGEMEQANKVLKEQNSKLRDVITKSSNESEPIDDSTIVASFVDLRQQIQRIASKFYAVQQSPHLDHDATHTQKSFFGLWHSGLAGPPMRNRTRAQMFRLLSDSVLCRPCFGVDGFEPLGELEAGLANFEMLLNTLQPGKRRSNIFVRLY
jgi:DNA repair exonuclease SbcCD ATPase subunit